MLFTPHLFVLDGAGQKTTISAPKIWGQSVCIVPRSECSFRRIKITDSSRRAIQAAYLKVRKEASSPDDRFLIVPDADQSGANVWGYKTAFDRTGRYYPESLARTPMETGARLVTCFTGYEGQVWKNNNIVASRWWPTVPDARKWQSFVFATQNEADIECGDVPKPQEIPFRDDLPKLKIELERTRTLLSPLNLAKATALVLGCGTFFLSGQYGRNLVTLNQVQNQINDVSKITGQISSERRRAIANMNFAQKYNSIGHNGTFFMGLDGLGYILDGKGLQIERIALRSGELEVRLKSTEEISVPEIVSNLEAMPSLTDVSIGLGDQNTVIVKATLIPPFEFEETPLEVRAH